MHVENHHTTINIKLNSCNVNKNIYLGFILKIKKM